MSCSTFKEIDSPTSKQEGDNLVILLNKDGSVSVDDANLHNFLENKDTVKTSVSILRVTSPTPSIDAEIDEQMKETQELHDMLADSDKSMDGETSITEPLQHISLSIENFYPPEEARKLATELIGIAGKDNPLTKKSYEYARNIVFNDHCYTPFSSPSQKIPKRAPYNPDEDEEEENKVDSKSLSKVSPNSPKPSTSSAISSKEQHRTKKQIDNEKSKEDKDKDDNENSDHQSGDGDSDSEVSLSSENSENDRDSDLDFNINDRLSTRTKKPGKRGRRRKISIVERKKRPSTSSSVSGIGRDHLDNDDLDNKMDTSTRKSRGGKTTRVRKNSVIALMISKEKEKLKRKSSGNEIKTETKLPDSPIVSMSTSSTSSSTNTTPTNTTNVNKTSTEHHQNLPHSHHQHHHTPQQQHHHHQHHQKSNSQTPSDKNNSEGKHINLSINTSTSKVHNNTVSPVSEKPIPPLATIKQVVHKKKPPAQNYETMFMSALFSTPDIIKKVNTGNDKPQQQQHHHNNPHQPQQQQQQQQPQPQTHHHQQITIQRNEIQQNLPTTPNTSKSNIISDGFMALSPTTSKNKNNQLPSQIIIQTHPSAVELASEQDKQLDLIDSIVKQELEKQSPHPPAQMNEDIPNIVKMLENSDNLETTSSLLQNVIAGNTSSELNNLDNVNNLSLLADANMLDNLNNPEDGLTEDLLQHVAELVENKNLQEIIDKQVLGVQDPIDHNLSNITPLPPCDIIQSPHPMMPSNITIQQSQNNLMGGNQNELHTNFINTSQSSMLVKETPPVHTEIKSLGKFTNTPNRKEPIQIIRSDGRVITLPPIEAPTTRGAKKRAQNQPNQNESQTQLTPKQKVVITNFQSDSKITNKEESKIKTPNSSQKRMSTEKSESGKNSRRTSTTSTVIQPVSTDSDDNMDSDDSWNSEDDPDRLWCICKQPHNNRFMICCDSCEDWFHGKCVNITKLMGQQMEENGIEWTCPICVKKKTEAGAVAQTFTERIKTANGEKTNEITSLKCIVCKIPARQNSIYCSDDCIRKHAQNASSTSTSTTTSTSKTFISQMKKISSQGEQQIGQLNKSITVDNTINESMGVLRNKNRVIVFERKTGRCLAGNSAPTLSNLKQWLAEHPTFEIVKPGSAQAEEFKAKHLQLKQNAAKVSVTKIVDSNQQQQQQQRQQSPKTVQTQLKFGAQKQLVLVNPSKGDLANITIKQSGDKQQKIIKVLKSPPIIIKQNQQGSLVQSFSVVNKPQSPKTIILNKDGGFDLKSALVKEGAVSKVLQKDQKISIAKDTKTTPAKPLIQKKISLEKMSEKSPAPTTSTPSSKEPEPIRINVKRTLKEQLIIRTSEIKSGPKLTPEEIEEFAESIELEMFRLFNKETGTKYKAKYRSLIFNIKDRKNTTLFSKISDKSIDAKQLVRMNPEEMASQELAQWRENENKHQLEMIKKSELDLLACTKNYVLKTHKGEEVIESKVADCVELDPTVAVEDVVSMLNNSAVSSTSDAVVDSASKDKYRYDKYDKLKDSDSFTMKLSSSPSLSSSSSSKKKEKRHNSRSRDRHESSSHKSSKHKKHKSRERRSRSRSRSRHHDRDRHSKSRERARSRSKETKHKEITVKKEISDKKSNRDKKDKHTPVQQKIVKEIKVKSEKIKDEYNLVDRILEASSSSSALFNEENDKKETIITDAVVKMTHPTIESEHQEPTSTVTIQTPPDSLADDAEPAEPIWFGNIRMIDLTMFKISLFSFNSDHDYIKNDLPNMLEIVGRIPPKTAYDYLEKIKKSPSRDIVLMKFEPFTESEQDSYTILFDYLHSRRRLGVIKTESPLKIKDFYLLPLPAFTELPNVLQQSNKISCLDGKNKTNLLIAIIIPIKAKRTIPHSHSISSKMRKLNDSQGNNSSSGQFLSDERFTPPNSPKDRKNKNKRLIHGLPRNQTQTTNNTTTVSYHTSKDDEPYSPGGSDEDLDTKPQMSSMNILPPIILPPESSTSVVDADDLQRKMDEINRQIEAHKIEIAGILTKSQGAELNEPYSPSRPVSPSQAAPTSIPALANIAIPSNLQEILASIKNVPLHSENKSFATTVGSEIGSNNQQQKLFNDEDEEYNPLEPTTASSTTFSNYKSLKNPYDDPPQSSKLAQLSDAELLSMVPDDELLDDKNSDQKSFLNEWNNKKETIETIEPPPPGLEDEYNPI